MKKLGYFTLIAAAVAATAIIYDMPVRTESKHWDCTQHPSPNYTGNTLLDDLHRCIDITIFK